jgi:phenylalanyl-tRNA synthetase alpha chain
VINTESVEQVRAQTAQRIDTASSLEELESVRVQEFGKKGQFTLLMKGLKDVDGSSRKELGALLNQTKKDLELRLTKKKAALELDQASAALESEWIDVSLPVDADPALCSPGSLHPLSAVRLELEEIFLGLGFSVVDGPEVEGEYYNFEALNIPSTHPARDLQDTFFTKMGSLLRTHTSTIQVRALENLKPPLRIVAPGRCFRCERLDASHEHTFYQMEGMMIDRVINVGHLIHFLKTLLREIFGHDVQIRLRPGYFPFVEPGFELDAWFQGKWMEMLGCGLVHPKVLEYGGIDPNEWQGFAFGLGLSRLAMLRYQIDDIRHLQGGDLRFLKQFS